MRPIISALPVWLFAAPLWAFPCSFGTECLETGPCAESAFKAEILLEDESVSTEFGELTVVASKETGTFTAIFATGPGMEVLISLTPGAARLTAHMNDGPQSITYLGQCEGAF